MDLNQLLDTIAAKFVEKEKELRAEHDQMVEDRKWHGAACAEQRLLDLNVDGLRVVRDALKELDEEAMMRFNRKLGELGLEAYQS